MSIFLIRRHINTEVYTVGKFVIFVKFVTIVNKNMAPLVQKFCEEISFFCLNPFPAIFRIRKTKKNPMATNLERGGG